MTTLLIGFPVAWAADVEYTFTDLVEPTANGASFTKFPPLSISPCVTYNDVIYYVPDPDTLPTEGDTPDTDPAWAVLGFTASTNQVNGEWEPIDGSSADLALVVNSANYSKTGSTVVLQGSITYPTTADTEDAVIAGLPFANAFACQVAVGGDEATLVGGTLLAGAEEIGLVEAGSVPLTNADLSGKTVNFSISYVSE